MRTHNPPPWEPSVTIALLMAADLRLCGTYFPTTSELSQFVLTSPTVKRRMLEPLASVKEEGFRERGQREVFERDVIYASKRVTTAHSI